MKKYTSKSSNKKKTEFVVKFNLLFGSFHYLLVKWKTNYGFHIEVENTVERYIVEDMRKTRVDWFKCTNQYQTVPSNASIKNNLLHSQ